MKNTFQKNRAVSEGDEFQELETTSVQKSTGCGSKNWEAQKKGPPRNNIRSYVIIHIKKQSKKIT